MGEPRETPPRREHERGQTHGAGARGRVTPFRLRRAGSSRAPQPDRATTSVGRPGGVGVDLRAGRSALPPIPSRPRSAETPTRSTPAVVYTPGAVVAPPRAAPSRPPTALAGHPHRRTRRIALVGLICAQVLVAATTVWALTTPRFQTRRIRVAGASDAIIVRRVQALPLTGCNIFACDTAALARQVDRLPAVASATVSTVYPDGLLVRVTPRQPALLWHTSAAELVIATDGTVLGTVSDDPVFAALALPRIEDGPAVAFEGAIPAAGARIDPLLAKMAAQLRKGLQPVLGDGWALDYDARIGLVAVKGSGRVLFGTPRDAAQAANDTPSVAALLGRPASGQVVQGVRMQLAELQALLKLLAGQGQRAALIDLRWGAHPYYRLAS